MKITNEEYLRLKQEHSSMFKILDSIRSECFEAVFAEGEDELVSILETIRLEATKEISKIEQSKA